MKIANRCSCLIRGAIQITDLLQLVPDLTKEEIPHLNAVKLPALNVVTPNAMLLMKTGKPAPVIVVMLHLRPKQLIRLWLLRLQVLGKKDQNLIFPD